LWNRYAYQCGSFFNGLRTEIRATQTPLRW
jgi:hypothetical protein